MAVYEHLYETYEGASPSVWSRFLVIPRYALRDVFKSKLLVTIFSLCFIYPLVGSIQTMPGLSAYAQMADAFCELLLMYLGFSSPGTRPGFFDQDLADDGTIIGLS